MNYELIKQLDDAGFKFIDHSCSECKEAMMSCGDSHPTLSELIEACGERFGKLVKEDNCWYGYDVERKFTEHGRTPEEAVAKFWLELNKK